MEIVLWVFFSFIAGAIAERKGRSGVGLLVLSLLLSPLVGIVVALVLSPNNAVIERRELRSGDRKRCPACAELVRAEAAKCRYCGAELSDGRPAELTLGEMKAKGLIR